MKVLFFALASVLFVLLTPGLFVKLPIKKSKMTVVLLHSLIFVFLLVIISKIIYYFFGYTYEEGFKQLKGNCKNNEATDYLEDSSKIEESISDALNVQISNKEISKDTLSNLYSTAMKNIIVYTMTTYTSNACNQGTMYPSNYEATLYDVIGLTNLISTTTDAVTLQANCIAFIDKLFKDEQASGKDTVPRAAYIEYTKALKETIPLPPKATPAAAKAAPVAKGATVVPGATVAKGAKAVTVVPGARAAQATTAAKAAKAATGGKAPPAAPAAKDVRK